MTDRMASCRSWANFPWARSEVLLDLDCRDGVRRGRGDARGETSDDGGASSVRANPNGDGRGRRLCDHANARGRCDDHGGYEAADEAMEWLAAWREPRRGQESGDRCGGFPDERPWYSVVGLSIRDDDGVRDGSRLLLGCSPSGLCCTPPISSSRAHGATAGQGPKGKRGLPFATRAADNQRDERVHTSLF